MTERERFENWVQNETRLPLHAYWAAWLGWEARAQAKLEAQPVSGEARPCEMCGVPLDSLQARWFQKRNNKWVHTIDGKNVDCLAQPAPTPAASQKGKL